MRFLTLLMYKKISNILNKYIHFHILYSNNPKDFYKILIKSDKLL